MTTYLKSPEQKPGNNHVQSWGSWQFQLMVAVEEEEEEEDIKIKTCDASAVII